MGSSSIWFMILTGSAIVILCLSTAILICNYKRRNELSYEQKVWYNSLIGGMMAFVAFTYPIFYWVEKPMEALSLWLRVIPIIMGVIAFIIAFLNFQRKSGVDIRLQFIHMGGMTKESTAPQYIQSMHFHNYKDKPERIFGIYLVDSKNNYLNICRFAGSDPILIKAFETVSIDLSAYIFTKEESDIYLFDQGTFAIVLATSNGRYKITKPFDVWEPKSYKQCKIRHK